MGLFGIGRKTNRSLSINEAVKAPEDGAVFLDVREAYEFASGHLHGSVNVPLSALSSIQTAIPDKNTILYVYCASGMRSSRAAKMLVSMGYANVKNIGGVNAYNGPLEK